MRLKASIPVLVFATALGLGSALLFWVEPMVARLFLPVLGGTPGVWNTCMVFFQTALLGGYALAHFLSRPGKFSLQAATVVSLGLLACLILPPHLNHGALQALPKEGSPVWWLVSQLGLVIGLPFLFLSTLGPLLQRWFTNTGHDRAQDPYFLYVASNIGSLAGLLSYPIIIERLFSLRTQGTIWAGLFAIEILLVMACAWLSRSGSGIKDVALIPIQQVSLKQFCLWVGLAFVPSSLLLGVTTYLGTDIASIPLLWIIPLALYLLTFILAFADRTIFSLALLSKILPIGILGLLFYILTQSTEPPWLLICIHLFFFFVAALLCHGRLAQRRPETAHLTTFYLALSLGGMLGGFLNALIAPILFTSVFEYPLAAILACLAMSSRSSKSRSFGSSDALAAIALAAGTAAMIWITPRLGLSDSRGGRALMVGLPMFACYFASQRPIRFAMALVAVVLVTQVAPPASGSLLYATRNFFGVLRVTNAPEGPFHRLYHGTTVHGLQFSGGAEPCKPLSYYHPEGPLGDLFLKVGPVSHWTNVAAVGLGAGAVASYSLAGQNWTFYEIDPGVIKIARDTNFFSYLSGCGKGTTEFVLGDARLELQSASAGRYDVMILDAFSSGMIPTHLITREALKLYLDKLSPHGILAFHISSRHLDLKPVVAALAASENLICFSRDDTGLPLETRSPGYYPSHWVLMSRSIDDLQPLGKISSWEVIKPPSHFAFWTDDFVDIVGVLVWK
jgi:hypothetical protein